MPLLNIHVGKYIHASSSPGFYSVFFFFFSTLTSLTVWGATQQKYFENSVFCVYASHACVQNLTLPLHLIWIHKTTGYYWTFLTLSVQFSTEISMLIDIDSFFDSIDSSSPKADIYLEWHTQCHFPLHCFCNISLAQGWNNTTFLTCLSPLSLPTPLAHALLF